MKEILKHLEMKGSISLIRNKKFINPLKNPCTSDKGLEKCQMYKISFISCKFLTFLPIAKAKKKKKSY